MYSVLLNAYATERSTLCLSPRIQIIECTDSKFRKRLSDSKDPGYISLMKV